MCGTSRRWWGVDGFVADVGHVANLLVVEGMLEGLVALLKFENLVLSVVGSLRIPLGVVRRWRRAVGQNV